MKKTFFLAIVFCALITSACDNQEQDTQTLSTTGLQNDVEYVINNVDEIDIQGNFQVNIINSTGGTYYVMAAGADNDLAGIYINETHDHELIIRSNNTDVVELYIYVPSIKELELTGTNVVDISQMAVNTYEFSISMEGTNVLTGRNTLTTQKLELDLEGTNSLLLSAIDANHMEVDMTGTNEVTVQGTAQSVELESQDRGWYNGSSLVANRYDIESEGSANLYVYANNILRAEIDGTGNVYYLGSPTITRLGNGTGTIIQGSYPVN